MLDWRERPTLALGAFRTAAPIDFVRPQHHCGLKSPEDPTRDRSSIEMDKLLHVHSVLHSKADHEGLVCSFAVCVSRINL
jgi:hypothetical protein